MRFANEPPSRTVPFLMSPTLPVIPGRSREARALTNFAGNSVATVLVGHWTDTYNRGQLDRVLAGDDPFDERTMLDEDHSEGERSRSIPGVDRAEGDDTRDGDVRAQSSER